MGLHAGQWIALWLIALGTRFSAAYLLPNAEQDGYSYAEIIARLTSQFSAGQFRLEDLFGFWLPLFPLAGAIVNVLIDNPLVAGKILSASCGAASSVLLFAIAKKITRNIGLACLAFALIVLNPLHLLYSAACMTDVPHSCLVLASLWFVMKRQWLVAAVFGAFAGCIRIEAWMLVIVLPLIQFAYERRISLLALTILLVPPLAWLGISYLAAGNPFAYFEQRALYHASYLDFYPTRQGFASADIQQDALYFLLGANRIVVLAIIVAAAVAIWRGVPRRGAISISVGATLGYTLVLFGFMLFAYVTKQQPVLLPRYGLNSFVLGLPLLMWLIGMPLKRLQRTWVAILVAGTVIALCVRETKGQLVVISKVRADFDAHRKVAAALTEALKPFTHQQRCFSDDVAIRVLSGLPADCFLRSSTTDNSARQNIEAFKSYLREKQVAYLVFTRIEDSLPAKFYPDLGRSAEFETPDFQLVTVAFSPFGPDVWLYRVR